MGVNHPIQPPETSTKALFCRYCRLLYEKNLVCGAGGNMAARDGRRILLTPSGYSLRDVTPEAVAVLNEEGAAVAGETPSKDSEMHLEILRARADVKVVLHVHGAHIIAASALVKPGPDSLPPLTPGFVHAAYPLPMAPFLVPGSATLARVASEELSEAPGRALLLQNHGLITVGKDFQEAFNIAEEIDEAARVFILSSGKARVIPSKDLPRIQKLS